MYPSIVRLGAIHGPFLCKVWDFSQVEPPPEVMMILSEPILRLDYLILATMVKSYRHPLLLSRSIANFRHVVGEIRITPARNQKPCLSFRGKGHPRLYTILPYCRPATESHAKHQNPSSHVASARLHRGMKQWHRGKSSVHEPFNLNMQSHGTCAPTELRHKYHSSVSNSLVITILANALVWY